MGVVLSLSFFCKDMFSSSSSSVEPESSKSLFWADDEDMEEDCNAKSVSHDRRRRRRARLVDVFSRGCSQGRESRALKHDTDEISTTEMITSETSVRVMILFYSLSFTPNPVIRQRIPPPSGVESNELYTAQVSAHPTSSCSYSFVDTNATTVKSVTTAASWDVSFELPEKLANEVWNGHLDLCKTKGHSCSFLQALPLTSSDRRTIYAVDSVPRIMYVRIE